MMSNVLLITAVFAVTTVVQSKIYVALQNHTLATNITSSPKNLTQGSKKQVTLLKNIISASKSAEVVTLTSTAYKTQTRVVTSRVDLTSTTIATTTVTDLTSTTVLSLTSVVTFTPFVTATIDAITTSLATTLVAVPAPIFYGAGGI